MKYWSSFFYTNALHCTRLIECRLFIGPHKKKQLRSNAQIVTAKMRSTRSSNLNNVILRTIVVRKLLDYMENNILQKLYIHFFIIPFVCFRSSQENLKLTLCLQKQFAEPRNVGSVEKFAHFLSYGSHICLVLHVSLEYHC